MSNETKIDLGPRSTVSELISALQAFPPDFEVEVNGETKFSISADDDGYSGITIKTENHVAYDGEDELIVADDEEDDD